jgi:pyruvate dehydrogenase E2 component (dihydrolipoamide acetyltransferase)
VAEKILVPDIGGAKDVIIIEVYVKSGSDVNLDDPLITLEGDKASMDIPAPYAGKITEVRVKVGDRVSEGSLIALLETAAAENKKEPEKKIAAKEQVPTVAASAKKSEEKAEKIEKTEKKSKSVVEQNDEVSHAGPAVRRIASELNIDLTQIAGSGEKGRILKEDLKTYLAGSSAAGMNLPAAPKIDFTKFGEIEVHALSKIKKATAVNLLRSWTTIPHVTQFAEADITELETFRQSQKKNADHKKIKLTPIVFIMKAIVASLKEFPQFNSSLDGSENLILKKYFHIGVAVDTDNGLVVPVIRNVDQKNLFQLAQELSEMSEKARNSRLTMTDMQGACFTISSLGGIGGTAFTPIINAPEVAILGVSKSQHKPIYQEDGSFAARLMLPLSLSYDHRVIDGAEAARFIVYLTEKLADIRTLLL